MFQAVGSAEPLIINCTHIERHQMIIITISWAPVLCSHGHVVFWMRFCCVNLFLCNVKLPSVFSPFMFWQEVMEIGCSSSSSADRKWWKLKYGGCLWTARKEDSLLLFVFVSHHFLSAAIDDFLLADTHHLLWSGISLIVIFISSVKPTFFYVHIKLYFFNFIQMHHHDDGGCWWWW